MLRDRRHGVIIARQVAACWWMSQAEVGHLIEDLVGFGWVHPVAHDEPAGQVDAAFVPTEMGWIGFGDCINNGMVRRFTAPHHLRGCPRSCRVPWLHDPEWMRTTLEAAESRLQWARAQGHRDYELAWLRLAILRDAGRTVGGGWDGFLRR